jgi:hypothetical protein
MVAVSASRQRYRRAREERSDSVTDRRPAASAAPVSHETYFLFIGGSSIQLTQNP